MGLELEDEVEDVDDQENNGSTITEMVKIGFSHKCGGGAEGSRDQKRKA